MANIAREGRDNEHEKNELITRIYGHIEVSKCNKKVYTTIEC